MTRCLRTMALALSCLLSGPALYAQSFGITSIKGGYLNPKDARGGPMVGITWGRSMAERVDIGIEVDVFRRRYVRDQIVLEQDLSSGLTERQVLRELEYTTTIVPILATMHVALPSNRVFGYYLTGGFGGQFLFNSEKNYAADVSDSRFYKGLSWMVGGGVYFKLSRGTSVVGEVLYQNSRVSRSHSKTESGLPIRREVDLSGFGARAGLRFGVW